MVPVTDVLRQLQRFVNTEVPEDRRLILLMNDMQRGRCRLYHPSTSLITAINHLPGVEAEGLFVAEFNPATKRYEGTFHWLSKTSVTLEDCFRFQHHLNQFMALPGWSGRVDDLDHLPLPETATIGGLLVCKNADGYMTLAFMPIDLDPAVTLTHICLALTMSLTDILNQPEAEVMRAEHSMLVAAQQTLLKGGRPPRVMMLQTCLDKIKKQEMYIAGAGPGEEKTFFNPGNDLDLVFLLAARAYRDTPSGAVRYWVEWAELEPVPQTLRFIIEERLARFTKRLTAILDDQPLENPSEYVIGPGIIHAAWVITRHPHDGLSTKLLVNNGIEDGVGLAILEQAVHQEFLG